MLGEVQVLAAPGRAATTHAHTRTRTHMSTLAHRTEPNVSVVEEDEAGRPADAGNQDDASNRLGTLPTGSIRGLEGP